MKVKSMRVLSNHSATAFLFDSSVDFKKHANILTFQKVDRLEALTSGWILTLATLIKGSATRLGDLLDFVATF